MPDYKPRDFGSIFLPKSLTFIALKQSVLTWGGSVKFDDDGAPILPESAEEWKRYGQGTFLPKLLVATCKDVSVKVVHAQLSHDVYNRMKKSGAKKLLKDPVASCRRKADRTSPLEAAVPAVRTLIRGGALLYTSIFLVEVADQIVRVIGGTLFASSSNESETALQRVRRAGKAAGDVLWRCVVSLALEGVLGGVGTAIAPGTGTLIGQLVGGTVIWLV